MRRLTAFCCLLLLLLTMGGRTLFFELRLAEVRSEMRAAIAAGAHLEQAQTFSFSDAEARPLVWLDGGDEFEWKGKRFDVLGRRKEGEKLVVQAISDDEETALISSWHQQEGKRPSSSEVLLKLASLNFLAAHVAEIGLPGLTCSIPQNGRCRQLQPQAYLERPEQPPKVAAIQATVPFFS
ncbi:MAG: hypothetical protein EOO08_06725 [Chitinophagaceae bacterium]|nr:MAG: hypothetical protein EOO08_06725 [Chitinophagaceae bacterium]